MISVDNYEEFIVAYLDGELTTEETKAFKAFFVRHPNLQKELDEYKALILPTENVVFNHKEELYKKESAFIAFRKVWPYAAAILFFIACFPLFKLFNGKEKKTIVAVQPVKTNTSKAVQTNKIKPKAFKQASNKQLARTDVVTPKKKVKKLQSVAKSNKRASIPQQKIIKTVVQQSAIKDIPKDEIKIIKKEIIEQKLVQEEKTKSIKQVDDLVQEEKIIAQQEKRVLPPSMKNIGRKETTLLTINEEKHPVLFETINSSVDLVEQKINQIKELKETPITVCVGKMKLFTINH